MIEDANAARQAKPTVYETDIRRWAIEEVLQTIRDTGEFHTTTDITSMAEHITRYVLRGDNHGLCPLQSGHA